MSVSSASLEPSATGQIEVAASPARVYALVSDPSALAEVAEEYAGHRWLGGASSASVGARFKGSNKRGFRRWNTISTITDADDGSRFAFEVSAFGIPVARWQYDLEPAGDGCRVTESTWEKRPGWWRYPTSFVTGVWDREQQNRANIQATLARLKARVEAGA
ncbi:SRPBCC family protein [Amycolatopsis nigrescens]|uniref:SRPBCC family protein n=1 Tax=Amycolatopsis nigrescens TaxID=381445 RepID=UPI00059113A8|nr:SRPBCC family protein [Amycolatopsis nigrescens]